MLFFSAVVASFLEKGFCDDSKFLQHYHSFSSKTKYSTLVWGAKVHINANCKKSFLICKFTFSTQDFCSNITNFMLTW